MTEAEAREWIRSRYDVSRETQLERFADLLRDGATTQNLIAPSTLDQIWARHIVDSAQLLDHAPDGGTWVDIGSGAGLPGIILAILRDDLVDLVEPRKLRTAFLQHAVDSLGLTNVTINTAKVERTHGLASIITARAVGPLENLFRMARHRADRKTVWVLPKGRNAELEVEVASHAWQGSFHVEPSITAPDSLIVVAKEVRPR